VPIIGSRQDVPGFLFLSRSAVSSEPAFKPSRHKFLRLLLLYAMIGSASSVECRAANSRPASAPNWRKHVDGSADPKSRSNPRPVPLIFPIFPGDVDPVDPSMAGLISLSPLHLFSWPAPWPFEEEPSLNVHKQPNWHLAPGNTAARSTGKYDRPDLKKRKEKIRPCAALCFAILTPAITIFPDLFVPLLTEHHVGSEDPSAKSLL
jgi:hypothetical protein